MTQIRELYFQWLCGIVDDQESELYQTLLKYLFDIPFQSPILMDDNRIDDGLNLRYHFGDDECIDMRAIASEIDIYDCSILEIMVALAIRMERDIMHDDEYGDRTTFWFWNMIENLGLIDCTDNNFDIYYVDSVIDRFLNRDYDYSGEGGLFTVFNPREDMRNVEIWYQAMWYLCDYAQNQ